VNDNDSRLQEARAVFRRHCELEIAPRAQAHDRDQHINSAIVPGLAAQGWLAPFLPSRWGGQDMDMQTLGLLHEETGRACSSVRSLLTVHGMAAYSILRWGSEKQRERWLQALASGRAIGALAVSEPNAGSNINDVQTIARAEGDSWVLDGTKKWMTFGQIADVFILLAKCNGEPIAFALARDTKGLRIEPINDMLGTRGSMLARLELEGCSLPQDAALGRPGFGNLVALSALGFGRYSVACGSVGIAQACLDACLAYAGTTRRSGALLREQQLVMRMITDMVTDIAAARLLCQSAGRMKDEKDPQEIAQTFIAKYHASVAAMRAADNAVQIHGANGCHPDYPVERYLRDAKVMEIIEGTTQIQQTTIASLAFQEYERERLTAATPA
jgi:glutaryl-CoA dehydrogenase (non-decarboxylating)